MSIVERFKRMTAEQRLIVANIGLFLLVGGGSLALMTQTPTLPEEPPIEAIEATLKKIPSTIDPSTSSDQKYQNFGQKNIFPVLVPTKTPEPTPPPTAVPDPVLEEAIKDWKLGGFGPNLVFMTDLKSREEWVMDLDDPASASRTIRFQNQEVVVRLEPPIDEINLKVTFSYTGRQGKQTVDKYLYSD